MAAVRRAFLILACLAIAATAGAMSATTITCGVGLLRGTKTWCGLGFVWLVAIPASVTVAAIAGPILHFAFWRLRFHAVWHFAMAGVVASLPLWFALAQPFGPARWQQSGLYDTLNYVGTGLLAALCYWLLTKTILRGNVA